VNKNPFRASQVVRGMPECSRIYAFDSQSIEQQSSQEDYTTPRQLDPKIVRKLQRAVRHAGEQKKLQRLQAGCAKPPRLRRPKWSKEQDTTLCRLHEEGKEWLEISKHIEGRTPLACRLRHRKCSTKRMSSNESCHTGSC
jgi:hypothetical protein